MFTCYSPLTRQVHVPALGTAFFLAGSFHIYYFTPQGAKEVQALEVKRCTGQPTHPSSLLAVGAGESWESQRTLEDKSSLLDQRHLERLLSLCLLL